MSKIILVREKLTPEVLAAFLGDPFEELIKYVVDVERGIIAVGGELHADAEALLIEDGSELENLWGANFYPNRPPSGRIEYTSLINIRPSRGNPGMEVADPALRDRIRVITERLLMDTDEHLP